MGMSDVAYGQIKKNRNAIIFLIASGVVNSSMKYFTIKCFWKITRKMCLKVMARDKILRIIIVFEKPIA